MNFFFNNRYEYLFILDFGHHSVKLALLEIDKKKKGAGKFIGFSEVVHLRHVVSENKADFEKILATAQKALRNMSTAGKIKKRKLIIGVASEIAYGHSFSYVHKRENSQKAIDSVEIKNVIHTAEQRAYEDIRKKFAAESGYAETGVSLLGGAIQSIKVDGYDIPNPEGKKGQELQLNIFNSYLPTFYKKIFEVLAENLKIPLSGMIYEPYSVFESLKKRQKDIFEALIIDIGGRTTRVSLVRKDRLEDVKTFSFGGESLTRRIASDMKVGFWEAENIKVRYVSGRLSQSALAVVDEMLKAELEIFLRAITMVFKEFSHTTLLPSQIYIHGAGGSAPIFDVIMKRKKWKSDLSFLKPPQIYRLKLDIFDNIQTEGGRIPPAPKWFSVFSMADFIVDPIHSDESSTSKTLNRMARLIEK